MLIVQRVIYIAYNLHDGKLISNKNVLRYLMSIRAGEDKVFGILHSLEKALSTIERRTYKSHTTTTIESKLKRAARKSDVLFRSFGLTGPHISTTLGAKTRRSFRMLNR